MKSIPPRKNKNICFYCILYFPIHTCISVALYSVETWTYNVKSQTISKRWKYAEFSKFPGLRRKLTTIFFVTPVLSTKFWILSDSANWGMYFRHIVRGEHYELLWLVMMAKIERKKVLAKRKSLGWSSVYRNQLSPKTVYTTPPKIVKL